MRHLKKVPVVAAAIVALVFAATAFGGGGTLYVGHGPTGTNKNCSSPGYNSVQAAVDAASNGNTVYLCGAQFAEQVFVNKSITLTGDSTSGLTAVGTTFTGSTARYPSAFATDNLFVPQALLVITGGNVSVKGLTVSGPFPGNGGCAENEFGILALSGTLNLSQSSVTNVADQNSSLYGCQFGVAVQVGRQYWPLADFSGFLVEGFNADATIDHVTVSGYMKNGVTVDAPGSTVDIHNSTVTGGGRGIFGQSTAQNGIQIGRGATGNAHNNTVSGNSYTGTSPFASSGGILVFGGCGDPLTTGVDVHNNTLVNNDVGIYMLNEQNDCFTPPATATNDTAHNNDISNNAVTNQSLFFDQNSNAYPGYQAGIDEQGNGDDIHNNSISGAGYAPQTTPGMPFVLPIDTVSYPTLNLTIHNNSYK